jgi:hypothetical protein
MSLIRISKTLKLNSLLPNNNPDDQILTTGIITFLQVFVTQKHNLAKIYGFVKKPLSFTDLNKTNLPDKY